MEKLHTKCSALNLDFDGLKLDFLGSRKPVHKGIKKRYPRKRRYFTILGQCFMKTVADRHGHAANQNNHYWQAFQFYQHRWLWKIWTSKIRGFYWFLQSSDAAHTSWMNCDEITGDRLTVCGELELSRISWALTQISCPVSSNSN